MGVDWEVDELRGIATALLGTVDIVADPGELAADFEAMIASSQSRSLPSVSLRLWSPEGAVLESLRQVAPEVVDLTATGTPAPGASSPGTSCWAAGPRASPGTTTCGSRCGPGGVGDEMLAGRVSLVLADGTVATQALVKATWTDDPELSTRMDRHVAHYTGQEELADAIQAGVAAAKAGDDKTATVKLGRAVQIAAESGHDDTMRLLQEVVEVDDAESGTVRLKAGADQAAEMTLDTRSTRTVRLSKPEGRASPPEPADPAAEGEQRRRHVTATCPAGHLSATDDYCDTCGVP